MRRSSRATRIAFPLAAAAATMAAIAGSAPGFQPAGSDDFRISVLGPDGNTSFGLTESLIDVVHNSKRNEYLVTFAGDSETDSDFEIFGQRVSPIGTRIGPTFPISHSPGAGLSYMPSAAYNVKRDEYLVAFQSNQVNGTENEIYAQRLSGAGAEIGGDTRLTQASDAGVGRNAEWPALAYDSKHGGYLASWPAIAWPARAARKSARKRESE